MLDQIIEFKVLSEKACFDELWVMFNRGQFREEEPDKSIQAIGTRADLVHEYGQQLVDVYAMPLKEYFKSVNQRVYSDSQKSVSSAEKTIEKIKKIFTEPQTYTEEEKAKVKERIKAEMEELKKQSLLKTSENLKEEKSLPEQTWLLEQTPTGMLQ